MKHLFAWILALAIAVAGCACGAAESTARTLAVADIFEQQNAIDEALKAEMEAQFDFSEPEVIIDPYNASPLTAVVLFHTDEEIGGTITVKGKAEKDDIVGEIVPATDHIVPVYGLYNGETTQVELALADGRTTTVEVTTEKVNFDPSVEVQMLDESAYDYSKLTFFFPVGGALYALDSAGDLRWYYANSGSLGVHPLKNGHIMAPAAFTLKPMYYKEGLVEFDLNGKVYAMYDIPGGMHHDFRELPNGNLLVASDAPDLSSVEDWVVEIDRATGEVVWALDMKDLLSTTDGRSASMRTDGSDEIDWCHNNSVWYDAANDLVLLSCRHLDAIVAVNKSDKTLAWILGDPTGWEEADPGLFFTPVGDGFEWQYAQHEVTMLDNGDIMMFDNGTAKVKAVNDADRVTGENVYSRAVVYRIDTENMTIEQVFEYGKERGWEWYSDWISGSEALDGTVDNLWITAGSHLYSPEENRHDFYPSDARKPGLQQSTHVDQVVNGELAYELVVGAMTFRTARTEMYKPEAYLDVDAAPVQLGRLGETPAVKTEAPIENAEALAAEGWSFALDGAKLTVAGTYQSEKKQDDIDVDYVILQSETEARYYAVTQYKTDNDEGCAVSISGWLSSALPEGVYRVLVTMDGAVYDTGYQIEA